MRIKIRKESLIKKEVFIACPVCFSGSCFQLEPPERELACNDCGFVLAESPMSNLPESEECVFCGSEYFYYEAPLDLSFLGLASICYVCEARYKGIVIDHPDEKYKQGGAQSARQSEAAVHWKDRAEQYNRPASA